MKQNVIKHEIQAILSMNDIEITECAKLTEDNSQEKLILKVSNPLPTFPCLHGGKRTQ